MSISRRIQDLVARQDFDTIESDWLARMEEGAEALDHFAAVARTLVGQGEEERSRFLLEMLDDQLQSEERWQDRLALLRRCGEILRPAAEAQHRSILETLERLHGSHDSYAGLVETVGLHRAPHDIPKTWDKVGRLESLVTFDLGAVVWMEGKGAGRVVEVNLELQSFRVDFERFPKLAVGFRAAPKLLVPLQADHVLHRKLEQAEALKQLAEEDPPGLLRVVLTSYGQPRTAGDVKADLSGIVADSRWTSWWAAARKHPQVVTHGKGRQTYSWETSSENAQQKVWQAFEKAPPRRQIQILRRDGDRDEELRRRMLEVLAREGEESAASDPGLAAEIWFSLERSGEAEEDAPWSPHTLLTDPRQQPRRVLEGIEDRALRERAYEVLRQVREDWAGLFAAALPREEDPRNLDLLAAALAEEEHPELGRFYDGAINQPHKAPAAFAWLVERAAVDEALRSRSPLRLFQQALAGPSTPELAPYRLRLLAQVESGGTVVKLLKHLAEDHAAQAEEAVHRAAGLEPYQREDLVKALHLRFPSLRGEAKERAPLYALTSSIEAKRSELGQILEREIPANRKAIEEARAMGDLRENFEYKAARQRHEYLTARATELNEQLARARPLDVAQIDPSVARVGTRVELAGEDGSRRSLTILGPWESNPDEGVISYESELGQTLLGKGVGSPVQLADAHYTVTGIAACEG